MTLPLLVALAVALVAEPPTTGNEPPPPRFGMSLTAGVGLGMRQPLLPASLATTRVRPSAALRLAAMPWIERPAGHGLAVRVPFSYATTLGARAIERGPGLDGTRALRSHRLELAVDVLAALGSRRRVWLGGGLVGGYTAIDLASPRGLPVGHGLGLATVRVPALLVLARGRLALGTAPGIGVALGDPRVAAMGVPRAGLGLTVSSWLRVSLVGRLGLALHHTEQHARFADPDGVRSDHWRTLTAGVVLTAGSPPARTTRSRTAASSSAPTGDHDPRAVTPEPPATSTSGHPSLAASTARPAAPALVGTTLAGEPIELASLRGRVVIVDFWASWCAPCREAMPRLQALHDELGSAGVVVIGVSVDDSEADARAFLEAAGIGFPIVLDTEQQLAAAWEPRKMPTTFVIDREGAIAAVHAGYTTAEGDALRVEVDRLLAESPPR